MSIKYYILTSPKNQNNVCSLKYVPNKVMLIALRAVTRTTLGFESYIIMDILFIHLHTLALYDVSAE